MRILFFGQLKNITRCSAADLPCEDTDADGVWRALIAAYPGLEPCRRFIRLTRNSEYAARGARFHSTDEVALIPPVSGG